MKQIAIIFFITLLLSSCKFNKKISNSHKDFKVVDTEMAMINPGPNVEILEKDTTEFLKFWKVFYKYYQQNDITNVIKSSFDSVDYSYYQNEINYDQQEIQYISIKDFLNSQYGRQYNLTFIPFSRQEQFHVYMNYQYNTDTRHSALTNDSVLLNYDVNLISKEINGRYDILRMHSFLFIKVNGRIKFSGLRIGEANSRFRKDSTTLSNLYFPLYDKTRDSIINLNALDTFSNLWYSAYLSEFKEPYLYNCNVDNTIYRFIWLRSFHSPIIIRFQKNESEYILTTKEMERNYIGIPDTFIVNTTHYLTKVEWDKLEFKLGRINFWNLPTLDPELRSTDGAEWILEATLNGKYHFTTRTMTDPAYEACCKYLLLLSKLKIPEKDIY